MGGRGSGGAGGGGARGGGGGGKALGSAKNPVTSGQLNSMTTSERASALRAMPEGTIISRRAASASSPTRYKKNGEGSWDMEVKESVFSNRSGRFQTRSRWSSAAPASSTQLAQPTYSGNTFASVVYPRS